MVIGEDPPAAPHAGKECRMQVEAETVAEVTKRLRRAEGQIRGVIAMLESGRECSEIVMQLAAVSRALDRAGFKVIAGGLQQCLETDDAEERSANVARMEKLFLSLA
jgi:DNA-binding FrmR family transcriptional regulator